MLELLISILLMMGVEFHKTDSGQVSMQNGSSALTEVRANKDFEMLGGEPALNAVVILDGTEGKE